MCSKASMKPLSLTSFIRVNIEHFSCKIRNKARVFTLTTPIPDRCGVCSQYNKTIKRNKKQYSVKQEVELYLLADAMTQKILRTGKELSIRTKSVAEGTRSVFKKVVEFLYPGNEQL